MLGVSCIPELADTSEPAEIDLHIGITATSPDHQFIYGPSSASLFYDSDGSGLAQQIAFAVRGTQEHTLTVGLADFQIAPQ